MIIVIVEGPSDAGFIEGLARRLEIRCKVLLMRGNRPRKAVRLVKLGHFNTPEKVVVLKDVHRRSESDVKENLREIVQELGGIAHGVIVKRSIESWVLAGLGVKNAEDISDPVRELSSRMIRERGMPYLKSKDLLRRLAREIDLDAAARNSQTFKGFLELLQDD